MVEKERNIFDTSETSVLKQKCCHHWIVDMAAGPTSQGVCILCGAQKEFKNYLPDCLAVDKKTYEEWLRRQGDNKGGEAKQDERQRRRRRKGVYPLMA